MPPKTETKSTDIKDQNVATPEELLGQAKNYLTEGWGYLGLKIKDQASQCFTQAYEYIEKIAKLKLDIEHPVSKKAMEYAASIKSGIMQVKTGQQSAFTMSMQQALEFIKVGKKLYVAEKWDESIEQYNKGIALLIDLTSNVRVTPFNVNGYNHVLRFISDCNKALIAVYEKIGQMEEAAEAKAAAIHYRKSVIPKDAGDKEFLKGMGITLDDKVEADDQKAFNLGMQINMATALLDQGMNNISQGNAAVGHALAKIGIQEAMKAHGEAKMMVEVAQSDVLDDSPFRVLLTENPLPVITPEFRKYLSAIKSVESDKNKRAGLYENCVLYFVTLDCPALSDHFQQLVARDKHTSKEKLSSKLDLNKSKKLKPEELKETQQQVVKLVQEAKDLYAKDLKLCAESFDKAFKMITHTQQAPELASIFFECALLCLKDKTLNRDVYVFEMLSVVLVNNPNLSRAWYLRGELFRKFATAATQESCHDLAKSFTDAAYLDFQRAVKTDNPSLEPHFHLEPNEKDEMRRFIEKIDKGWESNLDQLARAKSKKKKKTKQDKELIKQEVSEQPQPKPQPQLVSKQEQKNNNEKKLLLDEIETYKNKFNQELNKENYKKAIAYLRELNTAAARFYKKFPDDAKNSDLKRLSVILFCALLEKQEAKFESKDIEARLDALQAFKQEDFVGSIECQRLTKNLLSNAPVLNLLVQKPQVLARIFPEFKDSLGAEVQKKTLDLIQEQLKINNKNNYPIACGILLATMKLSNIEFPVTKEILFKTILETNTAKFMAQCAGPDGFGLLGTGAVRSSFLAAVHVLGPLVYGDKFKLVTSKPATADKNIPQDVIHPPLFKQPTNSSGSEGVPVLPASVQLDQPNSASIQFGFRPS